MKRILVVLLLTLAWLSLGAAWSWAQADRTVTNTSKKGSLLVWPLVRANAADTIVKLSNDYYKSVRVKCAYRTPFPCGVSQWLFTLGPNQPVSWMASTGRGPDGKILPRATGNPPPLETGSSAELRCWAVDSGGNQQIAWNWLSGEATVGESGKQHWEYSAWRFAVNSSTTGATAGSPGRILLTGDSGNYDACPTALSFSFLRQAPNLLTAFPPGRVDNRLTLVPCGLDLTDGGATVYTSLATDDENGVAQTPPSVCVGCADNSTQWFSGSLLSPKLTIPEEGVNPFVNVETPGGRFIVHGMKSAACDGSTGVPLLGVMSMQFRASNGPFAGSAPAAVGFGQGYVRDQNDLDTATPISMTW